MRSRCAAAGVLAALLGLAGCGGDGMSEVTGTVSVDGKAVEKGSIAFYPTDGKGPTAGGEIVGGQYSARVPVGVSKVEIRVSKEVGRKKLYNTPDSPEQPILKEILPEKYNEKSELTFDVKPGKNERNWDVFTTK